MRKTLRYTLYLLPLLLTHPLRGQSPDTETVSSETPVPGLDSTRVRGLRFGVDLGGLSLLYFDPGRMTYNFSLDYEAWQDIYPVLEFGFQEVSLERDSYHYHSGGLFGRAGADVNLLKYEGTKVYEMMYAGLRYGFASLTQRADNIQVGEDYFGGVDRGSLPEKRLTAHWLCVTVGVRVEVFRNFFIGWSVLAGLKLAQVKDPHMEPYYIPGFGPGGKRAGLVFNYSLFYRIPLQTYHPVKVVKKRQQSP